MLDQGLFQKKALDKLRSPDQLDTLFTATTPAGWVALTAVLMLIFSLVLWSLYGVIAVQVTGVGLVVDLGGTVHIPCLSAGIVRELNAQSGQRVHVGQIVAYLERLPFDSRGERGGIESIADREDRKSVPSLSPIDPAQEKLSDKIPVLCPYNGTVTERRVKVGQAVSAGTALFSAQPDTLPENVGVLLYVPVLEGKKIKPGMSALISLSNLNSAEWGTLAGKVAQVSDYPISLDHIADRVGSRETAQWILQQNRGAAMEVRADLPKDLPAGYLRSSLKGSTEAVLPGTLCTAVIVVQRQAPIVKAFPGLSGRRREVGP